MILNRPQGCTAALVVEFWAVLSRRSAPLLLAGLLSWACATPEPRQEFFASGGSAGASHQTVVNGEPLPELRSEGGSAGTPPLGPVAGGPALVCGNGQLDDDETCDDGNTNNNLIYTLI